MLRNAFTALRYLVGSVLAVALMVVLHLPTAQGRAAARDIANRVVAGLFQGHVYAGHVTRLNLWRGEAQLTDVSALDPTNHPVVEGVTIDATHLWALLPAIRQKPGAVMPEFSLHARTVYLRPGQTIPVSIGETFYPRNPSPPSTSRTPSAPFVLRFPVLRLSVDTLVSTMGGVPVQAHQARTQGTLVTDPITIVVPGLTLARVEPTAFTPALDARADYHWNSRFETLPDGTSRDRGLMVATADLRGVGVQCHLEFGLNDGVLRLSTSNCSADSDTLDRVAQRPLHLHAVVDSAELTRTANEPLRFALRARINEQPFSVAATIDPNTFDGDAALETPGFDPRAVGAPIPASNLHGRVTLRRRGEQLDLDTRGLSGTVGDVAMPGVTAQARLHDGELTIDDVAVPDLGIHAAGSVPINNITASRVTLTLHRTPLERIPVVPVRLQGQLSGTVALSSVAGVPTAHLDLHSPSLTVPGASAQDLTLRGTATLHGSRPEIAVRLAASSVTPAHQPPIRSVRADLHGNPLHGLAGVVHADLRTIVARYVPRLRTPVPTPGVAEAPSTATLPVSVSYGSEGVRVSVRGGTIQARGQTGRLSGDVSVPSGGAPVVNVTLHTAQGDVRAVLNRDNLALQLQRFDVAWLGRVLGIDGLEGELDGHLDLAALRRLGGAQSLQWHHGRAPVIGYFELGIDARPTGESTRFNVDLHYNADVQHAATPQTARVQAEATVTQPASLSDGAGWLRGTRALELNATQTPLRMADALLPTTMRAEGTAALRLHAARAHPEAALETTLAWDLRGGQVNVTLARSALGALLNRALPERPLLTDAMRLRGAVCMSIKGAAWQRADFQARTYLGPEQDPPTETNRALPAHCTVEETTVPSPLALLALGVEGAVARTGPGWWASINGVRAALAHMPAGPHRWAQLALPADTVHELQDTRVDLELGVGPVDPDHWPFAETVGVFVPALARPALNAVATVTARVQGTALHPTVRAELRTNLAETAQLVGRDTLESSLIAQLAPAPATGALANQWLPPSLLRVKASARLLAQDRAVATAAGTANGLMTMHVEPRALLDRGALPGHHMATLDHLQVVTDAFELGRLRYARSQNIAGALTLDVRHTGDAVTPLRANATIHDFRLRSGTAQNLTLNAYVRNNLGSWEVQSCAAVVPGDATPPNCNPDADPPTPGPGQAMATVALPLGCNLLRPRPRLDRLALSTAMQGFVLDPFSPLLEVSPIVRVGGTLTGNLTWNGGAPHAFNGGVRMSNGTVSIGSLGMPVQGITMDLRAAGRHLDLAAFNARMGGGTMEIHNATVDFSPTHNADADEPEEADTSALAGLTDFDRCVRADPATTVATANPSAAAASHTTQVPPEQSPDDPAAAPSTTDLIARIAMRVHTVQMPVPREGTVLVRVSSDLDYTGELHTSGHTGTLFVERADLAVPNDSSHSLQDTAAHPEVFIIGETRIASGLRSRGYPIELNFRTGSRDGRLGTIWVRGDAFEVAARVPDGQVVLDDTGTNLRFDVEGASRQSYYELLGKRFYLDRASVSQLYSAHLNPTLDIAAHYDGNDTGRIGVTVSGSLDEPTVVLTAEQQPGASQSDILALLVLGRRDSRGAAEQNQVAQSALAMVSSLAFGLGTTAVSREVRESRALPFVPRIIAEPNFSGNPNDIGRYGAGVSINSNIYIEGTYGTATGAGGAIPPGLNTGPEARLLVEVAISEHFSLLGYFGGGGGDGSGTVSGRGGAEFFYQP